MSKKERILELTIEEVRGIVKLCNFMSEEASPVVASIFAGLGKGFKARLEKAESDMRARL